MNTTKETPEVGDIIYNSWGYGQRNIDYYLVEKVTAKFVTVVQLAAWIREEGCMQGPTAPKEPHVVMGEAERHSWRPNPSGEITFKFKFGCGYLWDGKPKHCSWYN